MASFLDNLLTPGNVSNGVLGLSMLFGSHASATAGASTPLAMIKAGVNVADNAKLIAQMFISTNPDAANTALAIAGNANDKSSYMALVGTLEAEINSQNGGILSHLSQAVRLSTALGVPASTILAATN